MPAKDESWREFLRARGFVDRPTSDALRMWMWRDHFYIRESRGIIESRRGNFATCSGSMRTDGAFHPTIEAAYAAYVAWLLTKSRH